MKSSQNLHVWKDSEIIDQLAEWGVECDPYERREGIKLLQTEMLKRADEDMKKTKDYVEKLKEEDPGLELRTVIFHSVGEQDIPYVFVGHNGRAFYIPKEVEVAVPKYILLSCIKDAVEDRMFPVVRDNGKIEWIIRKVQRFPYSIVD